MSTEITDKVKTILARCNLAGAYAYFIENNSGNDLPYHNLYHTNCMVINCAEGAAAMLLAHEDTRTLLLSAIFHDFGHSGGKQQDDQNIRVAIAGLMTYCASDKLLEGCVHEAAEIIKATQYPYVAEAETLSQKIMQDADMMQMYMPGWEEQIFTGLRREIEVASGKEISRSDMIRMQIKFMEEVEWQTSWAIKRADSEWTNLIESVKKLEPQAIQRGQAARA